MKHFEEEDIYKNYFKTSSLLPNPTTVVIEEEPVTELLDGPLIGEQLHLQTDDDRDCLELICELFQQLTNAAWGTEWGEVSLDSPTGTDPTQVKLPWIVLDMNSREVQERRSLKPRQVSSVQEVINGKPTGDTLLVFQHSFDCILEVNFYANNMLEARHLMQRFEKLILIYAGFIKSEGVEELFFLKEVNSKHSINYTSHLAMKCSMFYVRFTREYIVRSSSIHSLEIEFDSTTGNLEG